MKMNVLIVDNRLNDPAIANMKKWIKEDFPKSTCEQITSNEFDPNDIIDRAPEIMIVDVALLPDEEKYFDGIESNTVSYDPTISLSGINYCYKLKSNFANIPVILASQFFHGKILSASIEAGADGFIWKGELTKEFFIPALKAAFYRYKTNDVALFEKLRGILDDKSVNAWKRDHMLFAMDAFFSFGSGTRRLTGLWCRLAGLIEKILPTKIVDELLRALMDTEALLLAANPRMRDHVRHSGNVFWLGYYLLNNIPLFREAENLPGYVKDTYIGSEFSCFDQLNLSWILCSLLHDIGYLREKLSLVQNRINRGYSLFSIQPIDKEILSLSVAPKGLDLLKNYLHKLGSDGKLLYSAIDTTIKDWGNLTEKDKTIEDHGLCSSSVFLTSIKKQNTAALQRPEILHAATAIALHNLSKWNKYWLRSISPVQLQIGLIPCAWLLAYCDELQGWGREPETDPFNVNNANDLNDARKKYKEGYIQGSRISSFELIDSKNCLLQKKIKLSLQYMMVHGENVMAVSDELKSNIEEWKREQSEMLRKTLCLDNTIETKITHLVPGPILEPITIKLNSKV